MALDQYIISLPDREKWAQFRDRLILDVAVRVHNSFIKKVKIEEDVDDGSFTIIERS